MAERHGSGPTEVVAIHGWGRDRKDWRTTLEGFNAIAVDLPGFGLSPPPSEAYGTHEYAAQLIPWLSTLDQPVLVGHSLGGRVAVRIAAASPALVRGLILTGAPLIHLAKPSRPPTPYRIVRYLTDRGVLPQSLLDHARARYGSADYSAAAGVMRATLVSIVEETYAEDLHQIALNHIPTRLIWGERDTAVPTQVAEILAASLGSSASLTILPGAGHLIDPVLTAAIRDGIEDLLEGPRSQRELRSDGGVPR
jgi:pimeloyl-ACP methyl ester carboxylesterase